MYCHPLNIIPRRKSNISIRDDIAKIYNLHSYQKTCQLIDVLPARHTPDLRRISTADESSQENSAGVWSCDWFRKLKAKRWFKPLVKTILFLLHFSVVFAVLGIGAMFLADIEDPAPSEKQIFNSKSSNETNNTVMIKNSDDLFWERLKDEFGVEVTTEQRESFMTEITRRVHEQEREIEQRLRNEERKDRTFIFWKWVYFTTVACTTIGYGDVVPETNNGRFFYMIFSLFGIPLMVSLLKACGRLIKAVNKRFFRFINSCCFKGDPWVSEDLMTIFSILLLFVGYVAIGCVFNAALNGRPLFDSIYYWIVTFSTVGFGDLVQPLEDQVNWAFPLMIYRIFGLAMLAGVIDAILDYMDYRKEYIQKKKKMIIRKSSERIASFRFDSKRKFKTPPPRPPSVAAEKMEPRKIAVATETENLPELVNESRHSNIFSHLANDVDKKNSFHDTRTFDDRINESVFGRMYDESGVESDVNDDYFIGDIDSQASYA